MLNADAAAVGNAVSIGLLPKFGRYRTGPCGTLLKRLHILTIISSPHESSTTKAVAFAAYSFEVHEGLRRDALTNVKPNEARTRELAQAPLDVHGAPTDFVGAWRRVQSHK